MNRRTAVTWVMAGGGLAVAGVLGAPAALTALSPALRRRTGEQWCPVGSLERFPIEAVRSATIELAREDKSQSLRQRSVYVWRRAVDDVVVYSRTCTDLGCIVTWDEGSECFFCPCHGGIFAKNGDRMAGPPPRPLYRFAHRVREGLLEIDLRSVPSIA